MKDNFTYRNNFYEIDESFRKKDLLKLLQVHDEDSFTFSIFTGMFNYALGKELKLSHSDKRILFESGLLHDTGKLDMHSEFINYNGKFTFEMFNEMKKHALGGGRLLELAGGVEKEIIDVAKFHHCNYDGSGYPGGLLDEEIPRFARITRVSDSIDAYLSNRCYKAGGPAVEAFDDLNNYKGSSYDPDVIDALEVIHKNIIDECHRVGEDRPSKSMYEKFLMKLYMHDIDITYSSSGSEPFDKDEPITLEGIIELVFDNIE